MRWTIMTALGLFLLPATAGLVMSLYEFLVGLQSASHHTSAFMYFLAGAGGWLIIFFCVPRPVRLYILGHELSHLVIAWACGIRGGRLEVRKDGGSVEVERSTVWVAMAPYLFPLYSLIVILGFTLFSRWIPESHFNTTLPLLVGVSWSFHLTFTGIALSQPQSDLRPYGTLGSLCFILFFNVLLLTLVAAIHHPRPFSEELNHLLHSQKTAYAWTVEQIRSIKNTIIQS